MQFWSHCYTVVSYQTLFSLSVYKIPAVYLSGAKNVCFCMIRDFGFPTIKQIHWPKALTKSPNRQLKFYDFALKLKWYDSFLHHQIARRVYCKNRNFLAVRTRCLLILVPTFSKLHLVTICKTRLWNIALLPEKCFNFWSWTHIHWPINSESCNEHFQYLQMICYQNMV